MTPNCSTWARCPTTSGLVEGHRSEHARFEVDGATAARDVLREHGNALRTVRDAIALHRAQNANDRVWRSGAREPFSTPPVLDRRFGSMAEQRTTNAPGGASCQRRALADCWPDGPTVF